MLTGNGTKSIAGTVKAAKVSHTGTGVNGGLTVSGTLNVDGWAPSSLDGVTLNGGTIDNNNPTDQTWRSNLTINTIANAPTGTIRNSSAPGSITFTNAPPITAGATVTASAGSLKFGTNAVAVGGGTLSLTGTGKAYFEGNLTTTGGTVTFDNSGTAVHYDAAGAQQGLGGITYYSLNMSGTGGTKTFAGGNVTIANGGAFHNTSATTDFGSADLVTTGATYDQDTYASGHGGTVKFGGTNGVLFTTGTVDYNANADQTIKGDAALTYERLLIEGTAGTKHITAGAGKVHVTTQFDVNVALSVDDAGAVLLVDGDMNINGVNVTNNGTITVGQ